MPSQYSGQYKTFRVLYVPDPSREMDEHPNGDLGWISRSITLHQYNKIRHLKKACFIEHPQPCNLHNEEIRVEIMEWVSPITQSIHISP